MTDESTFLEGYDPAAFDRPSLAVDVVVLTVADGALRALLVRRSEPPFQGCRALPGGFVRIDESLDDAARRVLRDKGGLRDLWLEQLYTFGDPGRDPRMRIVSVAYVALVAPERMPPTGGDRAVLPLTVPWAGEAGGPVEALEEGRPAPLAFDHARILGTAVQRLRGKLDWTPAIYALLPETFTLRDLQRVHETVLGAEVNKDSFRRKKLMSGELEATGERERDVVHRPAERYRFAGRTGSGPAR